MLNLKMLEIDASMPQFIVEAIELVNEDISRLNSSRDYKHVLTELKLDFDWLNMIMDAKDINEYKTNFITQARMINRDEPDDLNVVDYEIKPKLEQASTVRGLKELYDTYFIYLLT